MPIFRREVRHAQGPLKSVSEQALVMFSRQFATMIKAGLFMVACLDITSEQTDDRELQRTLIQVRRDVDEGVALSSALGTHPAVFSPLYVSMVKAGEVGGALDEVLERLARFMEKEQDLKKKIWSVMICPMIMLAMALGMALFLVTYILPTFVTMYEGMNLTLPLPTKILVAVTKGARDPRIVAVTLGCFVLILLGYRAYVQTGCGRRQVDRVRLKLPILGPLNQKYAISRFCRTLGTLLSSGVPIMAALDIVAEASGSETIAATVARIRGSLREGDSIATAIRISGMFPPMVTQMVAVGEETGHLDTMLVKISDYYDADVESLLASMVVMLQPIMIVGLGATVGFILISLFQPLYSICGSMS